MVLFICGARSVLYFAGFSVKRVGLHVVLSGLRMRLLIVSMYVFRVSMIECLLFIMFGNVVCCSVMCGTLVPVL